MQRFVSYDGTELVYQMIGVGPPLVCVPGGPGQALEYLGDLGGLSAHRTLILLDNRGTGESSVPADPATYRVDRLVEDVEALRALLGLQSIDLLGHSASGGVCMLYGAAHPDRLDRLVLVDPSLRAVGLASDVDADVVIAERDHEPWYADALAAYRASVRAETPEESEKHWLASAPLSYGRWGERARAHAAATPAQFSRAATAGFYAGFEPDVAALHERLGDLEARVLVIVGEYDLWPTRMAAKELVALFRDAVLVVQRGAGHFPWVDDAPSFVDIVEGFLGR